MAKPTVNTRINQLEKQLKALKGKNTTKNTKDDKSFSEKLKEYKTFVNRKLKGRHSKIVAITPNGKTTEKSYTRKSDNKTNKYVFKGVTIAREDGTTEEQFVQELPGFVKKMWL
ncbi:MAG: hypothetical protein R6U15_06505 [Candidatus Izemoplasmatales bacterium]